MCIWAGGDRGGGSRFGWDMGLLSIRIMTLLNIIQKFLYVQCFFCIEHGSLVNPNSIGVEVPMFAQ